MKKSLLVIALILIALVLAVFTSRTPRPLAAPETPPAPVATPTHLLQPRFGAAIATIGQTAYICGGWEGLRPIGHVEVLEVARGTITEAPFTVLPRRFATAVTWRNQILLVGGTPYETGRFIEAVDPATGSSRIVTRLPQPRQAAAVAVDGDRLIIAGGALDTGRRTGEVAIYDLAADRWTNGPALPTAREGIATVIGRHLYVIGGYDGRKALDAVHRLDLDTMTWEKRPSLPRPQSAHRSITDGDTVYLFGDYRDHGRVVAGNPETGIWRELDVGYQPARHVAAARIDNLVLIAGGASPSTPALDTIQAFPIEQLRNAPDRTTSTAATEASPPSPADQFTRETQARLDAIREVEIRGTTSLRYTVNGTTYTNTTGYALAVAPPNRVHLDTDSVTIWCNGADLVVIDHVRQETRVLRAPETLDELYLNTLRAYTGTLPIGHATLLDPTRKHESTYHLTLDHDTRENGPVLLGETTTVFTAHANPQPSPHEQPGAKIWIGTTRGLTLAQQSLPPRIPGDTDPDSALAIEQILETLDARFDATLVRINEPIDPSVFEPPTADAPERQVDPSRINTHPLSLNAIHERQRMLSNRRNDLSFVSLPATLSWSIPNPVETDFRTLPYGGESTVPVTHLPAITTSGVAIVNTRDGSIEQVIPLILDTTPEEINRHLHPLAGEQPGEDLLIIHRRLSYDPKQPDGPQHRITAHAADGSVRWEYEDRRNNPFEMLHILPRGPGRRQMLALVHAKTVEFVDADYRVLGLIRRGNLSTIAFDDRNADGWIDITLTGDTVQRYQWNETN